MDEWVVDQRTGELRPRLERVEKQPVEKEYAPWVPKKPPEIVSLSNTPCFSIERSKVVQYQDRCEDLTAIVTKLERLKELTTAQGINCCLQVCHPTFVTMQAWNDARHWEAKLYFTPGGQLKFVLCDDEKFGKDIKEILTE